MLGKDNNDAKHLPHFSQTAFIVGMQYNHYTVNEMADHIQICLVVLDTTPRVESRVNINITSAGTARVGSEYIMPDVLTSTPLIP
ncbi:hypothetical protein EMCRGX_G010261 [Ephydatia muelleri]